MPCLLIGGYSLFVLSKLFLLLLDFCLLFIALYFLSNIFIFNFFLCMSIGFSTSAFLSMFIVAVRSSNFYFIYVHTIFSCVPEDRKLAPVCSRSQLKL